MTIPLQLFIEVLVLIGGLFGIYIAVITRITRLESRLDHVESTAEKAMDQLNNKLDKITDELGEMRVMMENKVTRNNQ